MGCGLVQFDCDPVDYYRDVIRAGGFPKTMVELRRYQYKNLIEIIIWRERSSSRWAAVRENS